MSLELDHSFGCAPQDFWLNRAEYPGNSSIFTWLEEQVLPEIVVNPSRTDVPRIAVLNTGAMRFDIFKGPFTRDTTYIISPFLSKFRYIKGVPYSAAKGVLALLNNGGPVFESEGLKMAQLAGPEQTAFQENFVPGASRPDHLNDAQIPLGSLNSHKPNLMPGYTTKDGGGDDGDDTIHSSISFYKVPNCIESKIAFPETGDPETVDLVFVDFIQPWILLALTFTGQSYNVSDVNPYLEEYFTILLADWIKEHWKKDC
jgi:hypothetical protein